MKIIRPERLLKHMRDHNWTSFTAMQIEQFVEDVDLNEYSDFAEGYCRALEVTVEKLSEELRKCKELRKICESCNWFAPDPEVCICNESEYNCKFVNPSNSCEKWKSKGN